jgi:hypothetical protein
MRRQSPPIPLDILDRMLARVDGALACCDRTYALGECAKFYAEEHDPHDSALVALYTAMLQVYRASVWVLIEAHKTLRLHDSVLTDLLTNHAAPKRLRELRNAVFHFAPSDDDRIRFFEVRNEDHVIDRWCLQFQMRLTDVLEAERTRLVRLRTAQRVDGSDPRRGYVL